MTLGTKPWTVQEPQKPRDGPNHRLGWGITASKTWTLSCDLYQSHTRTKSFEAERVDWELVLKFQPGCRKETCSWLTPVNQRPMTLGMKRGFSLCSPVSSLIHYGRLRCYGIDSWQHFSQGKQPEPNPRRRIDVKKKHCRFTSWKKNSIRVKSLKPHNHFPCMGGSRFTSPKLVWGQKGLWLVICNNPWDEVETMMGFVKFCFLFF